MRSRTSIFTEPHYDGFPAVLMRLDRASESAVRERLAAGWWTVAPKSLKAGLDLRALANSAA